MNNLTEVCEGDSNDELAKISRATEQEALRGFQEWILSHTNSLMIGARWLSRLDELGVVVECIATDIAHLLRRIARGQIDPGLISAFGSNTASIEIVATLSIADQKRIANDPWVEVAVILENGDRSIGKLNVTKANSKQLKRLMSGGVILSPDQQVAMPVSKAPGRKPAVVKPDKAEQGLVIGNKLIDATQIRLSLEELSRRPRTLLSPEDKKSVSLAREAADILEALANERQCSRSEMLWRLIRTSGY